MKEDKTLEAGYISIRALAKLKINPSPIEVESEINAFHALDRAGYPVLWNYDKDGTKFYNVGPREPKQIQRNA